MNFYKESVSILKQLNKDYPSYPIGRHIWLAFGEEVIGVLNDKQFYTALLKYQTELDLGGEVSPTFLDDIVEDGLHLFDDQNEDNE